MFVDGLGDLGKSRWKKWTKKVVKVVAAPVLVPTLAVRKVAMKIKPVRRIARVASYAVPTTAVLAARRQFMKKKTMATQVKKAKKAEKAILEAQAAALELEQPNEGKLLLDKPELEESKEAGIMNTFTKVPSFVWAIGVGVIALIIVFQKKGG